MLCVCVFALHIECACQLTAHRKHANANKTAVGTGHTAELAANENGERNTHMLKLISSKHTGVRVWEFVLSMF